MRARHIGSVVLDKRRKTWNYLFCENGKRRTKVIGSLREHPTKASAWAAVETIKENIQPLQATKPTHKVLTVRTLVEQYRVERMPDRFSTRRGYDAWLNNHVLPRWGDEALTALQARPVELWLRNLALAPKSRVHIRTAISALWDYAKWSDVDWLNSRITIQRGIVRQHVGPVKTTNSERPMVVDPEMLDVLKRWKQTTQFSTDEDWTFASPVQLGRLPWSYPRVLKAYYDAGKAAGIGRVSTHTMRHTYRSWLDAVGAPITVQQKLMRHASVTTTLNVYGDVVTNEMSEAGSKVVGLALNRKVAAN